MKLKMYMTKDVLAGQFGVILTAPNDQLFRRNAKRFLSIPNSPLGENVEDTQIFHVADYDTESGIVVGCGPDFVCNLIEIKQELEDDLAKFAAKSKLVEGEKTHEQS